MPGDNRCIAGPGLNGPFPVAVLQLLLGHTVGITINLVPCELKKGRIIGIDHRHDSFHHIGIGSPDIPLTAALARARVAGIGKHKWNPGTRIRRCFKSIRLLVLPPVPVETV